jgi:YggT family protein
MGEFLYHLIDWLLGALSFCIILNVIISWLVAFDVINLRHPIAAQIARFLDAVCRPIMRPLQRYIPPIGGIDITPLIALVLISLVRAYLLPWIFGPIIALLHG